MEGYVTGNKTRVLDFFKENKSHHFTIYEARDSIEGDEIPASTFYRIVASLCKSGVLRRFEASGVDKFVYQYADFSKSCDLHFHL